MREFPKSSMNMRSVEEAQQLVLQSSASLIAVQQRCDESLGLVLAEPIVSDIDMPPYDKALMDGYAVRSADLPEGRGELEISQEILAGQTPTGPVGQGEVARIMTGAPIPQGADAVVMLERTSGQLTVVRIEDLHFKPGQNIMPRGTEMTFGQQVLRAGMRIRPPEIGVLAAVGRTHVSVYPRPRVAIISTGNEIVEAHETPGPGQIRNSNGPTLAALVIRAGGIAEYLGIARDTNDDLRRLILIGIDADMLLLSGGVSAGDLDLVPAVLCDLGVREVFHKVNFKPGKPVWFGAVERRALSVERSEQTTDVGVSSSDRSTPHARRSTLDAPRSTPHAPRSTLDAPRSTLVFGLPGNPVSAMACFELFVRPAMRRMTGEAEVIPVPVTAALMEERSYTSDRPAYWPAWLERVEEVYRVRPVAWHGSPDLRATTEANAFVILPPGEHHFRVGDRVKVLSTEY